MSEIYEANAKNWQSENPSLYRLQPLLRAVVAPASIQCLCAYLLFHFYMVDITLVVVVLVVWPTISWTMLLLLLLFVCFVYGVSGLHFYGNLTPFYCHTAALATLELSPAVINSATSAILWHAETLIRCQCPMWLPLTILPYSCCPLLLLASCCCCRLLLLSPLVVVVAYVVTWASSYRGFPFPFRYENIIYLHSFLLLKKLHCFPKLIGNLHTHTHS